MSASKSASSPYLKDKLEEYFNATAALFPSRVLFAQEIDHLVVSSRIGEALPQATFHRFTRILVDCRDGIVIGRVVLEFRNQDVLQVVRVDAGCILEDGIGR